MLTIYYQSTNVIIVMGEPIKMAVAIFNNNNKVIMEAVLSG